MVYAALGAVLRDYLFERWDAIPALRMIRLGRDELRARAERFISLLGFRAEILDGESLLGGGATPAQSLPTPLVRITPPAGCSASGLDRRLRQGDPPVVARIEEGALVIDLRTIDPEEDETLARAVRAQYR
jgi:L-seryl-tRNA(Ser) seleniumtransferase